MHPEVQAMVEALAFKLRFHSSADRPMKRTRFKVNAPPFINSLVFEGKPVRRLMSPPVPDDHYALAQMFDLYLWPKIEGEGDSIKELRALGPKVATFVERGQSEGERIARLLFALAGAPGATLQYDHSSISITVGDTVFGVKDGVVHSRFSAGLRIEPFNYLEYLTHPTEIWITNGLLSSLYKEAYRRRLDGVLLAICVGHPGFDFQQLARLASSSAGPQERTLKRWSQIAATHKDPAGALYPLLVPFWMTRVHFNRLFGIPSRRPQEATPEYRQLIINQLYFRFHKNKEKKK